MIYSKSYLNGQLRIAFMSGQPFLTDTILGTITHIPIEWTSLLFEKSLRTIDVRLVALSQNQ